MGLSTNSPAKNLTFFAGYEILDKNCTWLVVWNMLYMFFIYWEQ